MIYDCFTFFNELDLLELRLHTLSPHVDYFVIAEADYTFQGNPKPLYFHENRHLFHSFDSKIIWVPVRTGQTHAWSPWEREAYQRRAIRKHFMRMNMESQCATPSPGPDDFILLGDVDEIPDLEYPKWRELAETAQSSSVAWIMDMTYYWVDLWISKWYGTAGMKLGEIDQRLNGDFQKLRDYRGSTFHKFVGGWHFSFLGGVDAIQEKIKAFSHSEYLSAADEENIRQAVSERWKRGVDVFGRDIYKFRPLAAEECERLPRYLTDNRHKFSGFFMPDTENQRAVDAG